MYKIIENPVMMTWEEIAKTYDGYWIFMTNSDTDKYGNWNKAIPAVIADGTYAGVEDGIYDQFEDPKYGCCRDISLVSIPYSFGILEEVKE